MDNNLEFTYNWNNKLDCKYFHTLRLSGRWEVGQTCEVFLQKQMIGTAKLMSKVRYENFNAIPDHICYLDTGYDKSNTIRILRQMYKNSPGIEKSPTYGYVWGFISRLVIKSTKFQDLNLFTKDEFAPTINS